MKATGRRQQSFLLINDFSVSGRLHAWSTLVDSDGLQQPAIELEHPPAGADFACATSAAEEQTGMPSSGSASGGRDQGLYFSQLAACLGKDC